MSNPYLLMLDQAETHFRNHRFPEGADLVRNACFQALAEAAHTLNLPCSSRSEAWTAAETLEQIRPHPNPYIKYSISLLHANTYVLEAETRDEPGEDPRLPHEYIEKLYDKRIMIAALTAIAQEQSAVPACPRQGANTP